MTDPKIALSRLESILTEIERLDAETGGQFREESDREAGKIVERILHSRKPQKKSA